MRGLWLAWRSLGKWSSDLCWPLVQLRRNRPWRFAAAIFAAMGVLALVAIPVINWIETDSKSDSLITRIATESPRRSDVGSSSESTSTRGGAQEDDGKVDRLLEPRVDSAEGSRTGSRDRDNPGLPLVRLSDVLVGAIEGASFPYGSDGAEGSLLPLDNGVVPSSGPRFSTDWDLILPAAGIRAAVVQVGLTFEGAMGAPDNPNVIGWFNRSAIPGELGNALLGGHRDFQDRDGNVDIGVCWELDHTQIGDQMIIHDRSTERYFVYEIVDRARVHPDSGAAARYLSQTRESVITLITCAGKFDAGTNSYDQRIIVVGLLEAVAQPDA